MTAQPVDAGTPGMWAPDLVHPRLNTRPVIGDITS